MTAQPLERYARSWTPDRRRQRLADFALDDVLDLPPEAPRVELVNGVMIPIPTPAESHQEVSFLLCTWLRANAPAGLRSIMAVGLAVNSTNSFEPDVLLRVDDHDHSRHFFAPNEIVLAVEIVSPGTRRRDRIEKPAGYAAAGIAHYWRIEQDPVHVYAYQLGADGRYRLAADSTSELVLEEPFAIKMPIAEITP